MSSVLDFISAPFKLMMFACAYVSSFIDGRIIIIAVEDDEDDENNEMY